MKRRCSTIRYGFFAAVLGVLCLLGGYASPAYASGPDEQQVLVDEATLTFKEFMSTPEMDWFRSALRDAEGVLIVPGMVQAGLLLGGSGGKGVYLARDEKTGEWKGPAFYNMGSVSVGLQIGAEKSEVIVLAMTRDADRIMLSPQVKFGADASVAAGPVGGGGSAAVAQLPTAAFLSFALSKGAYAGLTINGAVVKSDEDADAAYYGRPVSPSDILVKGEKNAGGAGLRNEVAHAAARSKP